MARKPNTFEFLLEPLSGMRGYMEKSMFGCLACYAAGRMMVVLADDEAPWNGVMLPTDWDQHESIMADWPNLLEHPVLGKWLYLPDTDEDFEGTANAIMERIAEGDRRFGIEPKEKEKKAAKKTAAKKKAAKRPSRKK